MNFKYGDIIRLRHDTVPVLSLDAKTFFSLPDDEDAKVKTYWSLPEEAFEVDDYGNVYLLSEYARKLVWNVDEVIEITDEFGKHEYNRLNINVCYDKWGNVNCGAFCSYINDYEVLEKVI